MRFLVAGLVGLMLAQPAWAGGPRRHYLRAHAAVTEKLLIYEGFHTALLMRATLIDPVFVDALAMERARLLGPALQDPNALIEEMRLDREGVFEVVFAADSALPHGEQFLIDEPGWSLVLEADGVEQPLLTVEHLRDPTPMQRALFPQVTIWAEMYVARFRRTVSRPDLVELHVGSGYGHGTITWERTRRRERRLERAFRAMVREE